MASCSIWPIPAASTTAAPDIPEKISILKMLAWPSPPGRNPTSVSAKRKMRMEMPAVFMSLAARMNSGMASRM